MVSPRNHELLSVLLFGIGTGVIFLGYNVQCFFAESVIHSLHKTFPEAIDRHAGYYGQAIHYFGFAFFSLFTASITNYISSKTVLITVTLLFCTYYVGFFHITGWFYYLTQLLMGLGYAFHNNAEGKYLAEHSSEKTLLVNSGLETCLSHTGQFMCGIFLFVFNYFFSNSSANQTNYRHFSVEFIQIMYSGLLGVTFIGGIIFAFLPTKQQPDSIAQKGEKEKFSLKETFSHLYHTVCHANMLLLGVTCSYQGLFNSLYLGVYPTTLSFTFSLKDDVYIIAFYSLFVGLAQITGFFVISPLIRLIPKHRLVVTISVHIICISLAMAIINCTIPNESTIGPSPNGDLFINPSRWTVSLTGYLLGLSDYTITLSRCVICQLAVPEARAEVFSLTRVFMSISACIVLFTAPQLTRILWTILILTGALSGSISFIIVARKTGRSVRPTTET